MAVEKITGKFFPIHDEDTERTKAFLQSLGMTFYSGFDDSTFVVEVKQYPEVLLQLESAGYFAVRFHNAWNIISISEHGVTLYLPHPSAGDGYVFIPSENIVAIHTLEERFLIEVKEYSTKPAA